MNDFQKLHRQSLVADLHCDTVLWMRSSGRDLALDNSEGHIDLPKLRRGGVNLQVFACFIDPSTPPENSVALTIEMIELLTETFAKLKNEILVATTADEANKIIKENRIAAVLAIENGQAIAGSLDHLKDFYKRGIRYMTLTHSASHDWCGSSTDPKDKQKGLTGFGHEVIQAMNDLGMIIDISHISVKAVAEVLKASSAPVIASHSCVHAICGHDRNLTDNQIKAIADRGGMVGINFCRDFLSEQAWQASDKIRTKSPHLMAELTKVTDGTLRGDALTDYLARLRPEMNDWDNALLSANVSVDDVVDHIDYIVKLVGSDFVGLGSDFDGIVCPPDQLEDVSRMPSITKALLERDYEEEDIKKILGGNFMRVFAEVCG